MRRLLIALALSAGLFVVPSCASAQVDPTPTPEPAPLVPASGAWFGAWHKASPTSSWTTTEFERYESAVGRKMNIDHRFHKWGSTYWPHSNDSWDVANGRIPMASFGSNSFPGFGAINGGSQDAWLTGLADRIKAFGHPMFIRPMWEMNGSWMPYNGDPLAYVAAWRRMHDIFAQRGATNAVWVWSPNCKDSPRTETNRHQNYYPGDSFVDWVACDGYNVGTTKSWSSWRSWESVFRASNGIGSVYDSQPDKPFMVAETSSCDQGGDKGAWITEMREAIKARFPRLKAFVWFDEPKECDWRAESSAGALEAFRAMGADPHFQGTALEPAKQQTISVSATVS